MGEATCDVIVVDGELAANLMEGAGPPVIAMVGAGDVDGGLRALASGAADCLVGAPDDASLALALHRAARTARSDAGALVASDALDRLIGVSAAMRALRAMLVQVAPYRSTVLISGESGTGKELVARAIHELSPRASRRFVAVNCAAIPAPLLESELFGHRRGAFTDAVRDKPGLFEDAAGGTLFLDEVGELPLPLQVKLLRALQESEIRRVGDTQSIHVDVRLIAATNRDLTEEVRVGRFREDLFYRLNVLPVAIPPLRDRIDDVPGLVAHFVARHRARHGRAAVVADDALALLGRHAWPGNVRELENTIERVLVLAEGPVVDAGFVIEHLRLGREPGGASAASDSAELSIKKATRALEIELIRRALVSTRGNRTGAARLLEISHRALLYKIKEYGLG